MMMSVWMVHLSPILFGNGARRSCAIPKSELRVRVHIDYEVLSAWIVRGIIHSSHIQAGLPLSNTPGQSKPMSIVPAAKTPSRNGDALAPGGKVVMA